jgi:hypothetical protein
LLVAFAKGLLAENWSSTQCARLLTAIHARVAEAPMQKPPIPRAGTKQAMLILLLQRAEGAAMEEIIAATAWQAHSARGAMSGTLGKRLGLAVVSAKEAARGRVCRINR